MRSLEYLIQEVPGCRIDSCTSPDNVFQNRLLAERLELGMVLVESGSPLSGPLLRALQAGLVLKRKLSWLIRQA
jgi:hypothetical protein